MACIIRAEMQAKEHKEQKEGERFRKTRNTPRKLKHVALYLLAIGIFLHRQGRLLRISESLKPYGDEKK